MQIGNRILSGYDKQLKENTKIDNTKPVDQANHAKSSTDISVFKEGAVFKGEVLDITGDKVTISLENKAQLLARLQEGVELGIGDKLLFSVKENTASQILIKPVFDSLYSAQTQVLERALDAAGLSPTEKNFSAAKELMEAGLPVDKGNLVKLLSQSLKFEGVSMQTLAALNKMNIPVTEANIAQYERYQSYSHQLAGDISHTADSVAAFTEAFPTETPGDTLLSIANQFLDLLIPETPGDINGTTDSGRTANAADLAGETILTSGNGEIQTDNVEPQLMNTDGGMENASLMKSVPEEPGSDMKSQTGSTAQLAEKLGVAKEGLSHLASMLEKAGIADKQLQTLLNSSNSQEELLKNMLQALGTNGSSDAAVRNILGSDEFKTLFSGVIQRSWALNPKNMKDPKEIDELYNKILKQGKAFEEVIASKGGNTGNFNQNFQNMRQNMQFMEQLNNQMIYAQMPLKLSNQNANSELFVYADKRKLMEKKDGISVMLHLDMDHLGTTDVKVTLTGTNVNARFYLNDQQSVDIVADNMSQLAKQLADRGFSLTNEVIKRQPRESINKVVDEVIDENAERSIKRYTFDART